MKARIKIIGSNTKWTTFRYLNSCARGRMSTSLLKRKIEEGKIQLNNPALFSAKINK